MTKSAAGRRSITDPAALKALAHPLRLKLLAELGNRERATATELAAALGESSGSTSYHLRQLHRHGFIVEDPEAGTGRERVWRPTPGGWELPMLDLMDDETTGAAADLILQAHLQADAERALAVVRQAPAWPAEWQDVLRREEVHLSLSAEQTAELNRELDAVIERFRAQAAGAGARRVALSINTTPTDYTVNGGEEAAASDAADDAAHEGAGQRP